MEQKNIKMHFYFNTQIAHTRMDANNECISNNRQQDQVQDDTKNGETP